jgi:hypothetical protein
MTAPARSLFVSFEGFPERPDLTAMAESRAAWLRRRHRARLGAVGVHLHHEDAARRRFQVWATANSPTMEFVAHHAGNAPETALSGAFAKLDRVVRGIAGSRL